MWKIMCYPQVCEEAFGLNRDCKTEDWKSLPIYYKSTQFSTWSCKNKCTAKSLVFTRGNWPVANLFINGRYVRILLAGWIDFKYSIRAQGPCHTEGASFNANGDNYVCPVVDDVMSVIWYLRQSMWPASFSLTDLLGLGQMSLTANHYSPRIYPQHRYSHIIGVSS